MPARVHPVWLVLAGIGSVQFGAALAKSLFDEASPTTIVWLRLATSAVLFAVVARPAVRGRTREDWLVVVGLGLALATMNWSIYQSFARIPLGLAVTLEFVGPLALAVAGSRRPRDLLWVLLAAVGVALLGLRGGDLNLAGVLFALAGGAAWAGYILLSAETGRRWAGLGGLSIASLVAVAVMTPILLAGTPGDLGAWHLLAIGAAVGLLSSVIPYACELTALRSLAPAVVSILLSLEPAAAALAGLLLLGEVLSAVQWLAILCVVVASVGATRSGRALAGVTNE
ncbi:MAG: EamA family transporter [Solirubrobacteraceae bacterium]|nr:EamA family transporter [Solirubrobacteraceae bacterium]